MNNLRNLLDKRNLPPEKRAELEKALDKVTDLLNAAQAALNNGDQAGYEGGF
ncbi:MAG: hypothetical protein AB7F31_02865 [Parachlamydiales bacterium]